MRKISVAGQAMIDSGRINIYNKFEINGVDKTADLLPSYTHSSNRAFGVAVFQGTMKNQSGEYSENGTSPIKIGDIVQLTEGFVLPTGIESWNKFYGEIRQINPRTKKGESTVSITAFDVIVKLRDFDINKTYEATKYAVTSETLTPNYLPAPLEDMAQVYDFKNKNIALRPPVSITIHDKNGIRNDEPQSGGYEVSYIEGQIKIGVVLNARDNYEIIANYSYYVEGNFAEDIIEDIIIQPDGYGNNYFTAGANLRSTFETEMGVVHDYLLPNYLSEDIKIYNHLTVACSAGDTSITVTSTDGFLAAGTANINGWAFTYTATNATQFLNIPASGAGSLTDHIIGSLVYQTNTYLAGRVWYLKYSNIKTVLVAANFTIPGGSTIDYINLREGRIILDAAIDPYTDYGNVYTGAPAVFTDYTFGTIQWTGIEIPYIRFSWQDTKTRFAAITEIKKLLAPNYIIRTKGDAKIWGEYLTQEYIQDYTLPAAQTTRLSYAEDQDIYTRVLFFGKNNNPHNYMFDSDTSFVDTGETYRGIVYGHELIYEKDEGPWRVYETGLSASGFIRIDTFEPVVFINNVAVNNDKHIIVATQVQVRENYWHQTRVYHEGTKDQRTETSNEWTYTMVFSHSGLDPSELIYIYDATGTEIYRLGPNDEDVDYTHGVWNVPGTRAYYELPLIAGGVTVKVWDAPGTAPNDVVMTSATATYTIMYASDKVTIDYDNNKVRVHKDLLSREYRNDVVSFDFEYQEAAIGSETPGSLIDGRPTTQMQIDFYSKPLPGYVIATIDLGEIKAIDAIDLTAGFFMPDHQRRINVTNFYSIEYSINGVDFYSPCRETENFSLPSGEAKSWEREQLGDDFEARYLRLVLEDAQRVDYKTGIWCIALAELSVYQNVVIKGEAFLIPTSPLVQIANNGDAIIYLNNVESFTTPGIGENITAYIGINAFTYAGKNLVNNSLTGCVGVVGGPIGTRVSQQLEDATHLFDDDDLLGKIGDKLYKSEEVKAELCDQDKVNKRAKDYLGEFYKNHSRLSSNTIYCPHFDMGQTILIQDTENNVSKNYFLESITRIAEGYDCTLGAYP